MRYEVRAEIRMVITPIPDETPVEGDFEKRVIRAPAPVPTRESEQPNLPLADPPHAGSTGDDPPGTARGRKIAALFGRKARADALPDTLSALAIAEACRGYGCSYDEIAHQLNRRGFRTRRGRKYKRGTVGWLLASAGSVPEFPAVEDDADA